MRVVVVGAGFAGLRAAEVLRSSGCDVVVVEGGHRPGGRVRTVGSPFVDGQYSESGAEWVDNIHPRMAELLDRYGVGLLGGGEQWTVIRRWMHRNGELMSPERVREVEPGLDRQLDAFDALIDAAADELADPSRPASHPRADELDRLSLADAADSADLGDLARLFKRRDAQGEFAAEPSQVSLLFVAQQRAHQREAAAGRDVIARRIAGGASQLAEAMARDLDGAVQFGEHLMAVDQDENGVTVRTDQRSLSADHVVLACSLVPLRQVQFGPAAPAPLSRAIHELGYGTVTKTSVQWAARTWPAGYATTSGLLQRVYEPTVDQSGTAGILMSYCGGDGGHEWATLAESDRIARATSEMRSMYGIAVDALGGWSRAWSTERRYGGSYAVYEPGQITAFWDVLRAPWGRVHLAGEHVATCTGYMEGALESGETVATRIVAAG